MCLRKGCDVGGDEGFRWEHCGMICERGSKAVFGNSVGALFRTKTSSPSLCI